MANVSVQEPGEPGETVVCRPEVDDGSPVGLLGAGDGWRAAGPVLAAATE
jgi:hypothetical protein